MKKHIDALLVQRALTLISMAWSLSLQAAPVPSLSPIVPSHEEAIFDLSLIGIYQDSRQTNRYLVLNQHSDPHYYEGRFIDDYEYLLRGSLTVIEGMRFFELTSLEGLPSNVPGAPPGVTDMVRSLTWVPNYHFARITPTNNGVWLAYINKAGLANLQRKDARALVTAADLISSSTPELRAFLAKHGGDDEIFAGRRFLKSVEKIDLPQFTERRTSLIYHPNTQKLSIWKKSFSGPTDGQPGEFDLDTGNPVSAGAGNLIVEFWIEESSADPAARRRQQTRDAPPFTWRCRLSVRGGGLILCTNPNDEIAPEAGYRSPVEFAMPTAPACFRAWEHSKHRFYIKLRDGRYARLTFQVDMFSRQIILHSFVGSTTARNLIADPNKQDRNEPQHW